MNNKGFIATSLIYSFFLVFLALLAVILNSYVFNNRLIGEYNKAILNRINREIDSTSGDPSFIASDLDTLGIFPNLETPLFNHLATTDEGVFISYDNDGKSYYYRGASDNNYVIFGLWLEDGKSSPMYWRIIRINGDGSLRLMFDGYKTDRDYITDPYANVYWDTSGSSSGFNNAFQKSLNNFYKTNFLNTKYEEVISDSGFCSTRTSNVQNPSNCNMIDGQIVCSGVNKEITDFSDYDKIVGLKGTPVGISPSLLCNKEDLYTVSSTKGNGLLNYPIGLISSNEVAMAGGKYASSASEIDENSNPYFYLYKNLDYWTMSLFDSKSNDSGGGTLTMSIRLLSSIKPTTPIDPTTSGKYAFYLAKDGYISDTQLNTKSIGLYPVINIKEEYISTITGDGTMSNPFIINVN